MIEKIGGRGGTRTPGLLLAKQIGQKSKCLFWCLLRILQLLLTYLYRILYPNPASGEPAVFGLARV